MHRQIPLRHVLGVEEALLLLDQLLCKNVSGGVRQAEKKLLGSVVLGVEEGCSGFADVLPDDAVDVLALDQQEATSLETAQGRRDRQPTPQLPPEEEGPPQEQGQQERIRLPRKDENARRRPREKEAWGGRGEGLSEASSSSCLAKVATPQRRGG